PLEGENGRERGEKSGTINHAGENLRWVPRYACGSRLHVPSPADELVERPLATGMALDGRRDSCGRGCGFDMGALGVGKELQFGIAHSVGSNPGHLQPLPLCSPPHVLRVLLTFPRNGTAGGKLVYRGCRAFGVLFDRALPRISRRENDGKHLWRSISAVRIHHRAISSPRTGYRAKNDLIGVRERGASLSASKHLWHTK